MSIDAMLKNFDLFAAAPGAVGRLREVVLELAVTGKLLGTQSESWKEAVLGDIVLLISGQHLLGPDQNTERRGMPYLTGPADFGDLHPVPSRWTERPKAVAIPGDILITVKGAGVGKTNILASEPTAISRQLMAVRVKDASFHFVHLILKRAASYFQRAMTGIAIPGIGRDDVLGLRLVLPPLAEQQRIVAKVDELMAVCDRLEEQQRERDTRHAALARAALARFAAAPTPDNLQYLFHPAYDIAPDDLRTAILSSAIQGSYSAKMATSKWKRIRVHEAGRVDLGRQRAPEHHKGMHMRPYLRVQNVYEAKIDISDVKEMNFTPKEFETFELKDGDILLNEGQSRELVGRPAIYRNEVPGSCFQNTLVRFRGYEHTLPEYALLVFRAYMRSGVFQSISKQTTNIAHLSAGRFSQLEFPLPSVEDQRKIVVKVDRLLSLVDHYEGQLTTARNTAIRLLDALVAEFNGTARKGATTPSPPSEARCATASESIEPTSNTREVPARVPATPEAATRLLSLLRDRGSLSSSEAQAATGLDTAILRGLFKTLIDQGLVRTEGQRRGMRYLPAK